MIPELEELRWAQHREQEAERREEEQRLREEQLY